MSPHDCAITLRRQAAPDSDVGLLFRSVPDATDADPLDGLRAITALRARLEEQTDELALAAKRSGASWAAIGEALGMTRQSAHERWGKIAEFASWEPKRTTETERVCSPHPDDCRCDGCKWLGWHGWAKPDLRVVRPAESGRADG